MYIHTYMHTFVPLSPRNLYVLTCRQQNNMVMDYEKRFEKIKSITNMVKRTQVPIYKYAISTYIHTHTHIPAESVKSQQ